MYKILINIASFLLGYFIFLTLYTTYKNIEKFENNKIIKDIKDIKDIKEDPKVKDEIKIDKNELPNKNALLMFLTSYNNNIVNEKLKWYSEFKNKDSNENLNKGVYFSFNKIIQNKPFLLNDKILGADINNITLSGPNSDYFSNNMYVKDDLTHFTILYMIKINKLSETNTLFELVCNTTSKYDKIKEEDIYIPNSVYIKLYRIKEDIYNIILNIGSKKYIINDINNNIFNNDITFISFQLKKNKIQFILNNNIYDFDYESNDKLITSNQPIIINKNGNIDGILYNFAYYKEALNINDINNYKKYVNYYIYGAYNENDTKKNIEKELNELNNRYSNKLIEIKKLTDTIQNYVDIKKE
jgi:hypothetical protein